MSMADPGSARERTSLAWTRTALALLVNGVLVLARNENSFPLPVAGTLSALWVLLALMSVGYARQRRRLLDMPDDEIRPAGRAVWPLALGVGMLCVATALAIALT
jgi:uncharacterized membrane protein YidH (DUF202 family)